MHIHTYIDIYRYTQLHCSFLDAIFVRTYTHAYVCIYTNIYTLKKPSTYKYKVHKKICRPTPGLLQIAHQPRLPAAPCQRNPAAVVSHCAQTLTRLHALASHSPEHLAPAVVVFFMWACVCMCIYGFMYESKYASLHTDRACIHTNTHTYTHTCCQSLL